MKYVCVVAAVFFLAACGTPDPGEEGGVGCNFDTVSGTYLVHYQKVSGTCADLPDVVTTTRVNDTPEGCTTAKDEALENGCRHDFDYTCVTSGETDRIVGYLRQRDASADHFDGLITVYASYGSQSCVGTYDVTSTRQ